MNFKDLSDERLLAHLRTFIGCEQKLAAKVVAYLVEVEKRRLHLAESCTSMHDFCVRRLGMSEGETHRRLTAARLVARFPRLLEPLASGDLLLTNLVRLRDHFKEDNVDELIAAASGKNKTQIDELVARIAPKPDVPSSIQRVQEQASFLAPATTAVATPACKQVSPLSLDRYQVTFTARGATREKLERARDLSRHRNPSGDLDFIVDRALDLLIAELEKELFAKTDRPRKSHGSKDPANVTSATRRVVSARDDYQCTFRSAAGERCPARGFLEVDHVQPRGRGGEGIAANTRLLCRAHNRYEAERAFGQEHVARQVHLRQRRSREAKLARSRSAESVSAAAGRPKTPFDAPNIHEPDIAGCESAKAKPGVPIETPRDEPPHAGAKPPRELIHSALVGMGFTGKQAERAIAELPAYAWSQPLGNILGDAIRQVK